ncbi:retrovirus-related pol polyprotein from transposon TNT 1-94 [Tanacetum coccineum]
MHNKFEMSMMGELKFFLGIHTHQSPRGIFINQAKYAQEILKKLGMTSCDSIGTPMATKPLDANLSGTPVDQMKYCSMVGALMYLTTSRPDIVHATCCLNTRKSTYGGIQSLGGDKLVSWSSKKQDCTSMSSAEVLAAIAISCNSVQHFRTKRIDVRYHFIKEQVEKGFMVPVRIKSLLEVTAVKLVLLVQKLLLLVLKVNDAGIKVTTTERIKTAQRKDKNCLWDMYEIIFVKDTFGGNTATKKTQKNLLKQQYENFAASSTKVIEQTYEMLQKLISQLEMHGEVIPQKDINQKFLRSLSQEWTMHTIVWRNKPEIKTLSLDDLFHNLNS